MIPTEDDLNWAMAIECGYRWYRVMRCTYDSPPEGVPHRVLATEEYVAEWDDVIPATGDEPISHTEEVPRYCSDRNLLPEIKQVIDNAGAWFEFSHAMRDECEDLPEWSKSRTFTVTFAEPRLVVIAALKALGKWAETWESEGA